jgi:hypothetical protein
VALIRSLSGRPLALQRRVDARVENRPIREQRPYVYLEIEARVARAVLTSCRRFHEDNERYHVVGLIEYDGTHLTTLRSLATGAGHLRGKNRYRAGLRVRTNRGIEREPSVAPALGRQLDATLAPSPRRPLPVAQLEGGVRIRWIPRARFARLTEEHALTRRPVGQEPRIRIDELLEERTLFAEVGEVDFVPRRKRDEG